MAQRLRGFLIFSELALLASLHRRCQKPSQSLNLSFVLDLALYLHSSYGRSTSSFQVIFMEMFLSLYLIYRGLVMLALGEVNLKSITKCMSHSGYNKVNIYVLPV